MTDTGIIIETVVVGALATNCYVVAGGPGAAAAVIDPGDEADAILAAAATHDLKIVHIINTHGHYDHIGANKELAEATGASVYIHQQDAAMLNNAEANLSIYLGEDFKMPNKVIIVNEGEIIEVGEIKLKVRHTPGHTRGGISILVESSLFSGDLIFAGSVGRTDLPGGDFNMLIKSIREKVLTLPDDTVIYPGHGPATTVGLERISNPYLLG